MNMVFVSSTIVIQFLSILLVFNGIPLEFLKNLLAKTSAFLALVAGRAGLFVDVWGMIDLLPKRSAYTQNFQHVMEDEATFGN